MFGRERIEYKTPEQIRTMRRAGLVVADALAAVRAAMRPGLTTADLDDVAAEVIRAAGATPSFLGYHGFPATLCVSVNDQVVHGIPGPQLLAVGDVVSVDCGAIVDGWHGDAAFSVVLGPAGALDAAAAEQGGGDGADRADLALVRDTERAMWAGIAALASADRLGDVGAAIEDAADATGRGYGIVQEYVGHGIGSAMHQAPEVLNYRGRDRGPKVKPGLCVAIEPMLTRGSRQTQVLDDDWTVVTDDGSNAAHWEHTVAVGSDGIWVLTAQDGGAKELAELGVAVAPLD